MLDITLFVELRNAGYSVEDIRAYDESLSPAPAPAPAPAPGNDLLQTILDAIQNQNINRQQMQQDEVTADQVLANIINPKGYTPTK